MEQRHILPGFLQLLGETREIYRKRFGTVVGISGIACGLVLVILGVLACVFWLLLTNSTGFQEGFLQGLSSMMQQPSGLNTMVMIFLAGQVLLFLALTIIISLWLGAFLTFLHAHETAPCGILASYREAGRRFLSVWWVYLLIAGILVGSTLFFLIPGIVLSIFLIFGLYVLVYEDTKGFGALYRSYELVRGAWWKVFGRLMLLGIISAVWIIALSFFVGYTAGLALVMWDINESMLFSAALMLLIQLVVWMLLIPFVTIFISRMYRALATAKGAATRERPTTIFRVIGAACIIIAIASATIYPFLIFSNIQKTMGVFSSERGLEEVRALREADLAGFPDDPDFFTRYETSRFSLLVPRAWKSTSLASIHSFERNDSGVQFEIDENSSEEGKRKTAKERANDSLESHKRLFGAIEPSDMVDIAVDGMPGITYSVRVMAFGSIPMRFMLYFIDRDEKTSYDIQVVTLESDVAAYAPVFAQMIESLSFYEADAE